MNKRIVPLAVLCVAAIGVIGFKVIALLRTPTPQPFQDAFPDDTKNILENSEQFTLLSIDPKTIIQEGESGYRKEDSFHGYRVWGRTQVSPQVKARLIEALYYGMTADDASPSACFDPRHGIHAVHNGQWVDLIICFQCHQFGTVSFSKGKYKTRWPNFGHEGIGISTSTQSTFDRALMDAGVPLNP